jgi:hypothetical protein
MAADFQIVDSRTVRGEDGRECDVLDAIAALPWVRQLCPVMPHELNRCQPDSVEPLRRVDAGAKSILDWDGPPWAPNRYGKYQQDARGGWWPTESALADGYQPCKACQRPQGAI